MPAKRYCCVSGCNNSEQNSPELNFYSFPGRSYETDRKKKWIQAVSEAVSDESKPFEPNRNTRICSSHFIGGKKSNITDHPSYIPTIFPHTFKKKRTPKSTERLHQDTNKKKQEKNNHENNENTDGKHLPVSRKEKREKMIQYDEWTDPVEFLPYMSVPLNNEINIPIEEHYTAYNNNRGKHVCRLCLKVMPYEVMEYEKGNNADNCYNKEVFLRKKLERREELKDMIKLCLPFFDTLLEYPEACKRCANNLRNMYKFVKRCLKIQKKIEKCVNEKYAREMINAKLEDTHDEELLAENANLDTIVKESVFTEEFATQKEHNYSLLQPKIEDNLESGMVNFITRESCTFPPISSEAEIQETVATLIPNSLEISNKQNRNSNEVYSNVAPRSDESSPNWYITKPMQFVPVEIDEDNRIVKKQKISNDLLNSNILEKSNHFYIKKELEEESLLTHQEVLSKSMINYEVDFYSEDSSKNIKTEPSDEI